MATEKRHYPATKAEREQRPGGWDNVRDERTPEPRDPKMDRFAVGTNAPKEGK